MMVRLGCVAAVIAGAALTACVDGTTPDCSTIDSGCYPGDAAVLPDTSGDAPADVNKDADASTADAAVD